MVKLPTSWSIYTKYIYTNTHRSALERARSQIFACSFCKFLSGSLYLVHFFRDFLQHTHRLEEAWERTRESVNANHLFLSPPWGEKLATFPKETAGVDLM